MRTNPKKFLTIRLTSVLMARKQLVVNADDFGFTPDVNQGIVEAHRDGILTATTLMANGAAFDDAVRLWRETPTLDIGCHLVLIGGRSLVTGKAFPATVTQLLAALGEAGDPRVRRVGGAGAAHRGRRHPADASGHPQAHAPGAAGAGRGGADLGGIRHSVGAAAVRFSAAARRAVPRMKRLTSDALGLMRRRFHRVLARHGCRTTDHFAGFQITGRFRTAELVELMAVIPEGSTELMVHPGRCGAALRAAPTRLKESREAELAALVAPEVRAAMTRHGIELVNYAGLG